MARRTHTLAAATVGMLLLSGCATEPEAPPTPSASPSLDAPLFASDDEAVAAAEAALAEYWATADEIFAKSGSNIQRLEPLVSADFIADARATAEIYQERGWTQVGVMAFDSTSYQQEFSESDKSYLKVTTCLDYSNFSIVDAEGNPQLVDDEVRRAHEFTFEIHHESAHNLLVSGIEPWHSRTC